MLFFLFTMWSKYNIFGCFIGNLCRAFSTDSIWQATSFICFFFVVFCCYCCFYQRCEMLFVAELSPDGNHLGMSDKNRVHKKSLHFLWNIDCEKYQICNWPYNPCRNSNNRLILFVFLFICLFAPLSTRIWYTTWCIPNG